MMISADIRPRKGAQDSYGFTIVELLIVVVVIAILAAITIVAYSGIQSRARISALQSNLSQIGKGIEVFKVTNGDAYPATLTAANIKQPDNGTYNYQSDGTSFCLSGSSKGISYKVTNIVMNPSEGTCSGVLANGTVCPTNFISVPGNSTFGTSDFCVMKYEAKQASATIPVSQANGLPWTSISQTDAISYSPNVSGCTGCHLISDPEWLTIASNVLGVASNWSTGTIGSGYIYQGHGNNNPGSALSASTDDSDGLNGFTGGIGDANMNNRRTLTLSNGEVIWDFSGNVWEWVNASIAGGQQPGQSSDAGYVYRQYDFASMLWNGFPTIDRPGSVYSAGASWSSTQGIGMLNSNYAESATRMYIRGGNWGSTSSAGVLGLSLSNATSTTTPGLGFRVTK